MLNSKILFQLTGSIACYKSCAVISQLVQQGHEVQVVCSKNALQFIGKATLEGLTHRPVLTDVFEPRHIMSHIELSNWADLSIVCPATANTINKLAHGIADDLITNLFLTHVWSKPYLIVPAMNSKMLSHPATQNSLALLKSWGCEILPTDFGVLACGEVGEGKLVDPEKILLYIEQRLQKPKSIVKVLITAGATCEPIDAVRFITNQSTGKTGAYLAQYFYDRGYDVTYLHSRTAQQPAAPIEKIPFQTFSELDDELKKQLALNEFNFVIHAAAVSDFSVESIETGGAQYLRAPFKEKLNSQQPISLHLKKNFKIVEQLKSYSKNKNFKIIAFKLTVKADSSFIQKAVQDLLLSSDYVVHNDWTEISDEKHLATLFNHNGKSSVCLNKLELAQVIEKECFV